MLRLVLRLLRSQRSQALRAAQNGCSAPVPCETIHFKDEEIGARISTLRTALSEYPLISNCPTGEYCDKRRINSAGSRVGRGAGALGASSRGVGVLED